MPSAIELYQRECDLLRAENERLRAENHYLHEKAIQAQLKGYCDACMHVKSMYNFDHECSDLGACPRAKEYRAGLEGSDG